jgi:hypothetical protein
MCVIPVENYLEIRTWLPRHPAISANELLVPPITSG